MPGARRNVLVLGAQGVLGSVIARTFSDEGWEVIRAGRRPEAGVRLVDLARPETLRDAVGDVDLVANPVPAEGLAAERVVLERGPVLVNVSALPASLGWALKSETDSAVGTVLVHAGNVPGVTSLVASELLRLHPEADELELAFMISAGGTSGRGGAGLMHGYLTAMRHHPTFRAYFPAPLGTQVCFEIGPEERGWLSEEVVSGRTVRLGIYFRERPLQTLIRGLNALRIMRGVPRFAFTSGRARVPEEPTRERIAYWIAVKRAGGRIAARIVEGDGDYRMTAASTAAFGDALLERHAGGSLPRGVFAPEQLFTLEQLRPALERRGFTIANVPAE
jgi:hypothetical protein